MNKWTVPTAVLGGVLIIGALLLLMNYDHPYSETLRRYHVTVPIIPQVRGGIVEVPVEADKLVRQRDVLFSTDPEPFEDTVNSIEARLTAAEKDLTRSRELFAKQVAAERSVAQMRAEVDDLSAKLEHAAERAPGQAAVASRVTDPRFQDNLEQLPKGVYGQAALYSERFHHVGVMRRVLLRMASWMNSVFPLH